eukprot:3739038-Amphidinium_carterae.1
MVAEKSTASRAAPHPCMRKRGKRSAEARLRRDLIGAMQAAGEVSGVDSVLDVLALSRGSARNVRSRAMAAEAEAIQAERAQLREQNQQTAAALVTLQQQSGKS